MQDSLRRFKADIYQAPAHQTRIAILELLSGGDSPPGHGYPAFASVGIHRSLACCSREFVISCRCRRNERRSPQLERRTGGSGSGKYNLSFVRLRSWRSRQQRLRRPKDPGPIRNNAARRQSLGEIVSKNLGQTGPQSRLSCVLFRAIGDHEGEYMKIF